MKLTPDKKKELDQQARKTKKSDERVRLCVILARSEGISHELIAQIQRVSVETVRRYLADYENDNKTKNDPKGGRETKLTDEQSQE